MASHFQLAFCENEKAGLTDLPIIVVVDISPWHLVIDRLPGSTNRIIPATLPVQSSDLRDASMGMGSNYSQLHSSALHQQREELLY